MLVTVGRIGKPHGIRGSVTIAVLTDEPERRFVVGESVVTDPPGAADLVISGYKWHSGRLLMDFEGVTDRNGAEALRGLLLQVEVDQSQRPEDPEEYYDHQLVGLAVHHIDTTLLGHISEISHSPAQDLLIVQPVAESSAEILIPFVSAMVVSVDLKDGLVVDPPAGLLAPEDGVS